MGIRTGIIQFFAIAVFISFTCSCENKMSEEEVTEYYKDHSSWQAERIRKLKAPGGYLNLAGLYWLENGVNSIGSDSSNSIVFPLKAAPKLGTLRVTNTSSVLFEPAPGAEIFVTQHGSDSSWQAPEIQLIYDDSLKIYHQMRYASLAWNIIRRGDRLGVRLRDYQHPRLDSLQSIDYYPADVSWRTIADFEPYDPPKILKIQNVLGTTYDQPSPGRLVFTKGGGQYSLDVSEEGDEFFVTFADETSGEETYGGGRYMYTSKPDENGKVVLDFNKAYNPPCVYTEYATCPLPPPQNKLGIAVIAGEKITKHSD